MKNLCDKDCNNCGIISDQNSPILTKIFNEAFNKFGEEFYHIVQNYCPNLTCCSECHIDDFCHFENCNIVKEDI